MGSYNGRGTYNFGWFIGHGVLFEDGRYTGWALVTGNTVNYIITGNFQRWQVMEFIVIQNESYLRGSCLVVGLLLCYRIADWNSWPRLIISSTPVLRTYRIHINFIHIQSFLNKDSSYFSFDYESRLTLQIITILLASLIQTKTFR